MTRLWEIDHPYYCNEGNFFKNGLISAYASWASFVDEEGSNDMDLNLVFRWDWKPPTDDDCNPIASPDPYSRDGTLQICWMTQRKGYYRTSLVEVCQADEPAVREWLAARWGHMRKLWEPISRGSQELPVDAQGGTS